MKATNPTNHLWLTLVAVSLVAQATFAQTTTTYEYDSVGNRTSATNVFRFTDTQVFSRQPNSGLPSDRVIILGRNLPPGNGAGISVTIGGLLAPVLAVSTRVISVEVPVGRGTGQVIVTLPDAAPVDLGEFTFLDLSTDADGDCVPDALEPGLGLDPTLVDTDGDGVLDGDEDSDQDGLTNCEEVELGTNLAHPDSDGDGFIDGEEVEFGSDPLDPASDPVDPNIPPFSSLAFAPIFSLEDLVLPDPNIPPFSSLAFAPIFSSENLVLPDPNIPPFSSLAFAPIFSLEDFVLPDPNIPPFSSLAFAPIYSLENFVLPDPNIPPFSSLGFAPIFSLENFVLPDPNLPFMQAYRQPFSVENEAKP